MGIVDAVKAAHSEMILHVSHVRDVGASPETGLRKQSANLMQLKTSKKSRETASKTINPAKLGHWRVGNWRGAGTRIDTMAPTTPSMPIGITLIARDRNQSNDKQKSADCENSSFLIPTTRPKGSCRTSVRTALANCFSGNNKISTFTAH